MNLIDFVLHVDQHLAELSAWMGVWLYVLMFLVIFVETGLVVMPFLPGDSLLFALGALAAVETSELNVFVLAVLLMIAAIVGDSVNYSIGRYMGPKVFRKSEESLFFNKQHLITTQKFYEKYGAKAIVMARFVPIARTFAPFVAGIGEMKRGKFMSYNVVGGILWVNIFLFAGYLFGNLPVIKRNFSVVILAVIVLSVLPMVYEFIQHRREKAKIPPDLR